MAKATAKTVQKPAARPAPQATPTKAARAAEAQGRAAPPPKPAAQPRTSVPATRPAQAVADLSNMPAFMREYAGAGKENISREDMEIPRLKLIQALSPELEAYNELKAGDFFHSAAEEIFSGPFRAVPVLVDKQMILWNPRANGGGVLARSMDCIHWAPPQGEYTVKLDNPYQGTTVKWRLAETVRESGLGEWGTMNPNDPNSPPAATRMINMALAFPDNPTLMMAVLTFSRSSLKMGRRLLTKLMTVRTPLYGSIFTFEAFTDNNKQGQKFFNIQATGAGLVEDEKLFHQYREIHESMKGAGLNIKDVDSLQDEEQAPGEGEDGAGKDRPAF